MEEKNIQVTSRIELQDYRNSQNLNEEKSTYLFYGCFIILILIDIIEKELSGVIRIIIFWGLFEVFSRVITKKRFESNKRCCKEETVTFNLSGIEIIKTDGSGTEYIKWDELYGVKQNKNIIIFMTGTPSGYVLPKRFLTEEQLADLEDLIKSKLDLKLLKKSKRFKYLLIGLVVPIIVALIDVFIKQI